MLILGLIHRRTLKKRWMSDYNMLGQPGDGYDDVDDYNTMSDYDYTAMFSNWEIEDMNEGWRFEAMRDNSTLCLACFGPRYHENMSNRYVCISYVRLHDLMERYRQQDDSLILSEWDALCEWEMNEEGLCLECSARVRRHVHMTDRYVCVSYLWLYRRMGSY